VWRWLRRATATADGAAGGLWIDVGLYSLATLFAVLTAAGSTLGPHRAWGAVASVGYAAATAVALAQVALARLAAGRPSLGRRAPDPLTMRPSAGAAGVVGRLTGPRARAGLAIAAWAATAVLPLVLQAMQRAGGRADRAQEEVVVIEDGGRRLLETGTPYLDRAAIAALAESDRLQAYLPYQPGMAVFGIPRALDGAGAWWSDARIWFGLATLVALAAALLLLRRAGAPPPALVRGLQVATVLPVCALTLATGGDDLPVLALCLLALALVAVNRPGWAGLAVGAAAALKLFAWPVALVLGVHAVTRGRRATGRYAAGALALPLLTAVPALLLGPGATVENVLAFPFGHGLVASPAASPLPGHLIATSVPGGRGIAVGLLLAAGAAIAIILVRRPPRTAAAASAICGYGLLAAMLLLPSTRFGYLLYPAAFLVWTIAFRPAEVPERPGPATTEPARVVAP